MAQTSTFSALHCRVHPSSPPALRESGVLLCVPPPLVHANQACEPAVLRQEAKDHLARWPALQVMAEVLIVLRGAGVSWWEPIQLSERWPVGERLHWFQQRPDLREEIACSMTGLALRGGRRRSVSFQAELIEAMADPVLDAQRLEEAFDPRDVVVYGPVGEIWDEVVECIPWDAELRPGLVEQLLEVLIADRSTLLGGATMRPPIISPLLLRTAIDTRAWQAHLPARIRAAVDDARLHRELTDPRTPFTARDELDVVTVGALASSLPLRALRPVFSAAARLMGLEHPVPSRSEPAPKREFAEVANDGGGYEADADVEVTVSTG
jgi:hypothetical protein